MPPERKEPKAPIPNAPLRVIGPSDVQQQRQIWAPVQLLYAISAGIPAHGAGNVGITEVDGPGGDAFGPVLTFTGGGVTNTGNTFTFASSGAAITLNGAFTMPAVGATGTMNVLGDFEKLQDGTSFYIYNTNSSIGGGVLTNDQQGYEGQIASGGGTAAPTVLTTSLGTYSAGGTIASGIDVTWGQTPTIVGNVPSIVNFGSNDSVGLTVTVTMSGTPTVGNRLYAWVTCPSGTTVTPPALWFEFTSGTTASGFLDQSIFGFFHDVVSGDGTSWVFSYSGFVGGACGILEVSGGQFALQLAAAQYNNNDNAFSPNLTPTSPNSLAIGYMMQRNGSGRSTPTGWTNYLYQGTGTGDAALALQIGPATTMNVIQSLTFAADVNVSGLLLVPPGLTSTGSSGITQINQQPGPHISVFGGPFIGISTLTNAVEVINAGLTSATGPSLTVDRSHPNHRTRGASGGKPVLHLSRWFGRRGRNLADSSPELRCSRDGNGGTP